jgi:hypothetical protein
MPVWSKNGPSAPENTWPNISKKTSYCAISKGLFTLSLVVTISLHTSESRMYFCIRDDHTSFFTSPEELDHAYGKVTHEGPISLEVVPFHRADTGKSLQRSTEDDGRLIHCTRIRRWSSICAPVFPQGGGIPSRATLFTAVR